MCHKSAKVFLVFALFLSVNARAQEVFSADHGVHGEYSALGAVHRTGGAANKTPLRRGEFLTNELRLKIADEFKNGWSSLTNIHVRKTTDPQIDKRKDGHLLGFTSELFNKDKRFTVGDFFGDFSQYTMSQALEGLQASGIQAQNEWKFVAARSQEGDEGKKFARYVLGSRYEWQPVKDSQTARDFKLGLNYSEVYDDPKSIKSKAGVDSSSGRVVSLNSRALFWEKTDFEGELAQSWIDVFNYTTDTSRSFKDRKRGSALRLKSTTKFSGQAKYRLNFEAVDAYFNSLSGSAVSDRVNLENRLDYKLNKAWSSEFSYRLSFDKLNKSALNKRTYTHVPKLAFNWMPDSGDWLLKDFFLRPYWEMRKRSSQQDQAGHTDFTSNEFGNEGSFSLKGVNYSPGFSVRIEDDDFDKSNNRAFYLFYVGLNARKKIFGKDSTPSLQWQLNYEDKKKLQERDITNTLTAGLNTDLAKAFRLEQKYSVTTVDRTAHDSDTVRSSIYLALDYKVKGEEARVFKLSYEFTNFFHPLATERFQENNIQLKFSQRF